MQPSIVATDGVATRRRVARWAVLALSAHLVAGGGASRAFALAPGTTDVSGGWRLEFQQAGQATTWMADCAWEAEGQRLSGACTSGFESMATLLGRVAGDSLTFTLSPREGKGPAGERPMRFSGRIDWKRGRVTGRWTGEDERGRRRGGRFTAVRR